MIAFSMQHAFADLALDIAFESHARTLALFGDSGAGKTSVLNAIAGLLRPERGRIARFITPYGKQKIHELMARREQFYAHRRR